MGRPQLLEQSNSLPIPYSLFIYLKQWGLGLILRSSPCRLKILLGLPFPDLTTNLRILISIIKLGGFGIVIPHSFVALLRYSFYKVILRGDIFRVFLCSPDI